MKREPVIGARQRIKDVQHEAARFRTRAIAGFLLIAACLSILAMRFAYLQVQRHEEFSARSDFSWSHMWMR